MTLGERCYTALVAAGAHPFASAAKGWLDLTDEQRGNYEATGRTLDAATRADVVEQLGTMALNAHGSGPIYTTLRQAADRVEAGRG